MLPPNYLCVLYELRGLWMYAARYNFIIIKQREKTPNSFQILVSDRNY